MATDLDEPADAAVGARHAFTLAFVDPELEQAYRGAVGRAMRRPFRVGVGLSVPLWLGSWFTDEQVMGTAANLELAHTLKLLTVYPAAAVAIAFAFTAPPAFARGLQGVMGLVYGAVLADNALVPLLAPQPAAVDPAVGMIAVVLCTLCGAFLGIRFAPVLVLATLGNLSTAAALVLRYPDAPRDLLFWQLAGVVLAAFGAYTAERRDRDAFLASHLLAHERARSERLLRNVLPYSVAEHLKAGGGTIAEHFDDATVLFADLVGFTPLAEKLPPAELVAALDEIFSRFDDLAEQHGVEKIKTIGDAYMAVAGAPTPDPDHAAAVARLALGMQEVIATWRIAGQPLSLRIGIHSGPVVAGVIGKRKFLYDLWGDTVNTASRLESHGLPGEIQLSAAVRERLGAAFVVEARGVIALKGKGDVEAWLLRGTAAGGAVETELPPAG